MQHRPPSRSAARRFKAKGHKKGVLSLFVDATSDRPEIEHSIGSPYVVVIARSPTVGTTDWSARAVESMKTDGVAGVLSHILPAMASRLAECDDASISIGTTSFSLFLSLVIESGEMIKLMVQDLERRDRSTLRERLSHNFYSGPRLVVQRGDSMRIASFAWIPPDMRRTDAIMKVFGGLEKSRDMGNRLFTHEGYVDVRDAGFILADTAWSKGTSIYERKKTPTKNLPAVDGHQDDVRFEFSGAPLGLSVTLGLLMEHGWVERTVDTIIHTITEIDGGYVPPPLLVRCSTHKMLSAMVAHIDHKLKLAAERDKRMRDKGDERAARPCWMRTTDKARPDDPRWMIAPRPKDPFHYTHTKEPLDIFRIARAGVEICRITVYLEQKE
jgi:hypothetical protein